ncbi:M16 family metallopeptidase [Parasediminibacterium sp. JCM 36343]|uniref:M16 family metallopeptidase n=1 Tax=Parasediminibacterium sp. JCM 36343 TaxID=3374279 RepID=UPI0039786D16
MLNRKKSPKIIDTVELSLQLKPYTKFTLDNGVEVYNINAGAQEVVMVEMVFFAGNWHEEKNIVAATTNFMLKNGTKRRTAFAINEHFEFHGAYLNRSCQNETATFTLHTLGKHLPKLLPVMAELLTDSIFPEEELAIYKQNQKQRLAINLKKCDFVANRLIDTYLFGQQHPYGRFTSVEDYDALQRKELAAFYEQFYTHGKCILFVAGVLPSDIEEQLNNAFGCLPLNQSILPEHSFEAKPFAEKKHEVINDASGVQGAIRIASPFPNRHHPDFSKVQVLNNVFGGFFGSRLMSNIREDKGYTYGIHSYLQNLIQQTAWLVSTEAGRDVCAATIAEVYKEMARLRDEPIDAEELHLVRNFMMGSILGDLDGPFQIIARWKNYILNGLDGQYFYNALNTIKTVPAEELQVLAKKYLNEEDFYELVVI